MKKNNNLKIILDTNVFIVSLSSHFIYHWVFTSLQEGSYDLCISNEILAEYQEQLSERYGLNRTETALDILFLFPNVHLITPYYHWHLIEPDEDDNKFVDCAVAANADYIVSNDAHFKPLRQIDFPKLNVITVEQFHNILFRN